MPLLLRAAKRLEPLDAGLARETYRDALEAAMTAGRLSSGAQLVDIAQAALAAPPGPRPGRDDLLLNGLAVMSTEGYAAGVPMVRQALDAFRTEGISRQEGLGWLPLACRLAHNVWDFDNWSALSAGLVDLARETGALSVLPSALHMLASNRAMAGELAVADALVAEAATIGEATGSRVFAHYAALVVEPWKGREAATRQVIETITRDTLLAGKARCRPLANGRAPCSTTAWAATRRRTSRPSGAASTRRNSADRSSGPWSSSSRPPPGADGARAAEAARRLDEMAQASGTDWALGTSAVARAQVSDGPAAEALYREAIERLGRTEVRITFARARLLYGEWLRRENRRLDAREHLGAAYEMFTQMGAEAFAERARRELQATGETIRKRPAEARATLTAQEAQIARLASDGLTNPEIGAQLFISPHTVEWHLRKVFAKLGIASRKQIRTTLLDGTAVTA
ncbi:LuxR C-terminal-related transcriptional regulator [Streptosporangium lutulentum]